MPLVFKCDRCGAIFDKSNRILDGYSVTKWDSLLATHSCEYLCDFCTEDLQRWMKKPSICYMCPCDKVKKRWWKR